MKTISHTLFFGLAAIALLSGCKDRGAIIAFTDTKPLFDTTYVDTNLPVQEQRTVLIEEFTGVKCKNCPSSHAKLKQIINDNPDRVIGVAIHNSNGLAEPHSNGEDFRTEKGIEISNKLGGTGSIPMGAIDRYQFSGQPELVVFHNKWKNLVAQRLNSVPRVNIGISNSFDNSDRELMTTIELHYTGNVDSLNHLSIMVIEDGIIGPQSLPNQTVDQNYVHDHILRGMLTPANGELTHITTKAGRVVERQFSVTLPQHWNAENCHVVAFVHFVGGSSEVLQAETAPVK